MDTSAAFNLCYKTVLVQKLRQLGCSKEVCQLIWSYMTDRTNSVKVGGHVSEQPEVNTGVGEGSVLGLMIFLVQILEVDASWHLSMLP